MTADEAFSIWAPPAAIWSPWVKPVLFAHVHNAPHDEAPVPRTFDFRFLDNIAGSCMVVDLPGAQSVFVAMGLAGRGFRPVPLFNAIPSPTASIISPTMTAVDVQPILSAIVTESARLSSLRLPYDAPPAFLLDANRATSATRLQPGVFDNRSISLPTDFPSGNLLRSRGIGRVIVLQSAGLKPQPDLTHTLLRWKEAGIEVLAKPIDLASPMTAAILIRPRWFRSIFYQFIAMLGFRRNRLGGFGGILPNPGSGG